MRVRQLSQTSQSKAEKVLGRLLARLDGVADPASPETAVTGLETSFGDQFYIPSSVQANVLAPMVIALHGAGGRGEQSVRLLQPLTDATGTIVLAPDSRGTSWDILRGGFGPDINFIDSALTHVFSRYTIDPTRLAIGGFSDGASYALSVGITNGDLFSHILAFSPGFSAPATQCGAPRIYISHGTRDTVLPINRCSRAVIPLLRNAGYDVTYREFDGPHEVPPEITNDAFDWFLGTDAATIFR